ncbi:MAG: L,D-transpeptidase [Deltaproteobacteria bacterium]|nr:L,D-transpeptidase [Deltaproteobacteria bacterium]
MLFRLKPLLLLAPLALVFGCQPEKTKRHQPKSSSKAGAAKPQEPPPAPWQKGVLAAGHAYAMQAGKGKTIPLHEAQAQGLTVVDLSDNWVPFILSERDAEAQEPKPQAYRQTFIDLANDRVDPDVLYLRGAGPTKAVPAEPLGMAPAARRAFEEERKKSRQKGLRRLQKQPPNNFLEPFGIPPTITVLQKRMATDAANEGCYAQVDMAALQAFAGSVSYQSMLQAKREFALVQEDTRWVKLRSEKLKQEHPDAWAETTEAAELQALAADPKFAARVRRYQQGLLRVAAVKATQQRLVCEGLLVAKFTPGMFDLATHEALAEFERKNNIFSWGMLADETLEALKRSPLQLHFETFKRLVTERVADAASVLEDESALGLGKAAHYKDEAGNDRQVQDLVGANRDALLAALGVAAPEDVQRRFGSVSAEVLGTLKVAFKSPPKPPYYADVMQLEAEIDRGDVWYDFPFDDKGEQRPQPRQHYPHLTLFVRWNNQRIALVHWRTTIGSWRSERHPDGNVYYKYKNSDVGPRVWKNIVVSPVWIAPDGTQPKDLLTRKKFDVFGRPETVVNTDVIGPGFASAYGMVMAIHQMPSGYDNQIRTHGSVDYTSIARRYSHGCHRLVNNRAVRLFGFVLKHSAFERLGDQKLAYRKRFVHEGSAYEFKMSSRGYYFQLQNPIKVDVLEGNIKGKLEKPIEAFVRKTTNTRGDDEDEDNLVLSEGTGGPSPPLTAADPEPASDTPPSAPAAKPAPKVIDPTVARALSAGATRTPKTAKKRLSTK